MTHTARVVCMSCGCDLGPSNTRETSHGICSKCQRALLRRAAQQRKERLEKGV
jgi:predicted RNA-binding Zn-ribbon protein involved in translation (DUF1610 family)